MEKKDKDMDACARREVFEEITVTDLSLKAMGQIKYIYLHKPDHTQTAHLFICDRWKGTPSETEEIKPVWFPLDKLPLDQMWDDDKYWLQHVLEGMHIKAEFTFENYEQINKISLIFTRE